MIRNIKRVIAIVAVFLVATIGTQQASSQFRYGPTVGADITSLSFKQDLFSVDKAVGYTGGITCEMMFPGIGFGIDFGLEYQQRGATLHMGQREMWASQGYTSPRSYLHYATLPIHLRFKYTRLGGLEEKIAPLVYAGPSFGFLVGHSKIPALQYAGGDVSVDFGGGVELFQRFQLTASYSLGATYALKAKVLTNFSARSSMWNIRFAWLF